MWKWTDFDHLKVIILDGDTLSDEFIQYPYSTLIPGCEIFPVTINNKADMIPYIDITNLLFSLIQKTHADSSQFLSISRNPLFLKEMMMNHIGTILINNLRKEFLKYVPDFRCSELKDMPSILRQERYGYAAEVMACGKGDKKKTLASLRLRVELKDKEFKPFKLYFGGRYYAKHHQYLVDDPLSALILEFKKRPVKIINDFFDTAIQFIHKFERIDILTYVPLKPDEIKAGRFNRFESLELSRCRQENLRLRSVISCRKNFSQKRNDVIHRKENVQGAYFVSEDVTNQNVLVLDDVYASGITIDEIVKTLYEAGAAHVSVLTAGVNQPIESLANPYRPLLCPDCSGRFLLKLNSKENQLFWGCSNFKQGCRATKALDQGLREMQKKNCLEISDLTDLDDPY